MEKGTVNLVQWNGYQIEIISEILKSKIILYAFKITLNGSGMHKFLNKGLVC